MATFGVFGASSSSEDSGSQHASPSRGYPGGSGGVGGALLEADGRTKVLLPNQIAMLNAKHGSTTTKVVVRNTFVDVQEEKKILRHSRSESDVSSSSHGEPSSSFGTLSSLGDEVVESQAEGLLLSRAQTPEPQPLPPVGSLLGSHPSIGSIKHFESLCQSCSFFRKGRCARQDKCTYCHYPHEMPRRPSKSARVRGKARMAKASASGEIAAGAEWDDEGDDDVDDAQLEDDVGKISL